MRWSNSDPITGQAAWFDLRVNIEKAEAGDEVTQPQFEPVKSGVEETAKDVEYGKEWTK